MLHHAVIRKKVSLVEKLLQRKDLHDVVDEQGNTAFHLALKDSKSENAEKLIKIFIKQENLRLNFGRMKGRNKERG